MVRVATVIRDAGGNIVARKDNTRKLNHGMDFEQHFTVESPGTVVAGGSRALHG